MAKKPRRKDGKLAGMLNADVPETLTGEYLKLLYGAPDEGVTTLDDYGMQLMDETNPNVNAFAVGPLQSYYKGLDPDQQVMFSGDRIKGVSQNMEREGFNPQQFLDYLKGHEGYHARHWPGVTQVSEGNKGYMPTSEGPENRRSVTYDEWKPSGRENWLAKYYRPEERNEERLASKAGIRNVDEMMMFRKLLKSK